MDPDLIEAALSSRAGWRFSELRAALARGRWANVGASVGLVRSTYGTVPYLARDPSVPRNDLTILDIASHPETSIVVEMLDEERLKQYSDRGLEFYAAGEIDVGLIRHRLDGALRRLGEIPDAAAAVAVLVAVIHVMKPPGPNYDVSYSDPLLPFSIFVGIDVGDQANADLRLAEGILHECMHLQLTLIEEVIPMVAATQERHYSPWQRTMRPSQGVLHGLYVFRAIKDLYCDLLDSSGCTANERNYIGRRVKTIEDEVSAIGDFAASRDLTSAGKRLAVSLLAP